MGGGGRGEETAVDVAASCKRGISSKEVENDIFDCTLLASPAGISVHSIGSCVVVLEGSL